MGDLKISLLDHYMYFHTYFTQTMDDCNPQPFGSAFLAEYSMMVHTALIPGRLSKVPITGTLRKKFTATGKKPLKSYKTNLRSFCLFLLK